MNIVRDGAGMGPITEAQLSNLVENVSIGEASASLVDLSAATTASSASQQDQIILAVFTRAGVTWFFKMAGHVSVVSAQKASFLDFLKSIAFRDASDQSAAAASSTGSVAAPNDAGPSQIKPKWTVPPSWREVPATEMLLAKFLLPGQGEAKGEVTVSVLAREGGGLVANVNRWRGQLSLPEVGENDVSNLVRSLDVAEGKAMLVDMTGRNAKTGQKARLIAVILPQGNRTWFYKLIGDEALAGQEKESFLKFVQTAKHPNAA